MAWVTEGGTGEGTTLHEWRRLSGSTPFALERDLPFEGPVLELHWAPDCALFGASADGAGSAYFVLEPGAASPKPLTIASPVEPRVTADESSVFLVELGADLSAVRMLACPRDASAGLLEGACEPAPVDCASIGGVAVEASGAAVFTCDARLLAWRP